MAKILTPAVAYLRTSSATNVRKDKTDKVVEIDDKELGPASTRNY